MEEIEKDVLDEDRRLFKYICKASTCKRRISDDAERLFWEKKLYIENQELRKELGEKLSSKLAVAKENIQIRNDHVFQFLQESEGHFAGKQILNVGPGIDDDLIKRFESNGVDIINCDIILDPLIQLRSNSRRECVCSDLKSLPFDQGTFDAVFCFHVIHHVDPIERALSESIRVLKPSGKAFIIELNYYHLLSLLGKILPNGVKKYLRRNVRRHVRTGKRLFKPSPYERVVQRGIIIGTMRSVGFVDIVRKAATHSPMILPDYVIRLWNRLGFKLPWIFDPIALEYIFVGRKSDATRQL
jgi:ubiquinone/menaquinone biosynthesis C-methylase UbiE